MDTNHNNPSNNPNDSLCNSFINDDSISELMSQFDDVKQEDTQSITNAIHKDDDQSGNNQKIEKDFMPLPSYNPVLPTTHFKQRKSVDQLSQIKSSTQIPLIRELTSLIEKTPQYTVSFLKIEEEVSDIINSFPYKPPYPPQIEMINTIQRAICNGKHLLLESPTGTGKTLVLLHSTLSFNSIKVFYASRTHTQLSQVVEESRKIGKINGIVLASREIYCIYEPIHQLEECSYWCNAKPQILKKIKQIQPCPFNPFDEVNGDKEFQTKCKRVFSASGGIIQTQEETIKLCKRYKVCPYYYSRWATEKSKLVLCPYNFVTSVSIRQSASIFLVKKDQPDAKENVLVIDEAHNTEESLMESLSFTFSQDMIAKTVATIQFHQRRNSVVTDEKKYELLEELIATLGHFSKWIDERSLPFKNAEENMYGVFDPESFQPFLTRCPSSSKIIKAIVEYVGLLEYVDDIINHPQLAQYMNSFTTKYIEMLVFYAEVFRKSEYSLFFKIIITLVDGERNAFFKCFSPSLPMSFMQQQLRSIIFASGTLSPMKAMASELNIMDHPYKDVSISPGYLTLSTQHVVPQEQVLGRIVTANGNKKFEFVHRNQGDVEMMKQAGETIFSILKKTPAGGLVFFSSYANLNNIVSLWRKSGLYKQLSQTKHIFIESKNKNEFKRDFNKFKDKASSGAVFLGVFRGKLSEGIDFGNHLARVVIVVGIPFPSVADVNIQLKKEYNNKQFNTTGTGISGNEWYNIQALRAVNQAVGRVIRHVNDYGAFILLDLRYGRAGIKDMLSGWMKRSMKTSTNVVEDVEKFFEEMELRSSYFQQRIDDLKIETKPTKSTKQIKSKKGEDINIKIKTTRKKSRRQKKPFKSSKQSTLDDVVLTEDKKPDSKLISFIKKEIKTEPHAYSKTTPFTSQQQSFQDKKPIHRIKIEPSKTLFNSKQQSFSRLEKKNGYSIIRPNPDLIPIQPSKTVSSQPLKLPKLTLSNTQLNTTPKRTSTPIQMKPNTNNNDHFDESSSSSDIIDLSQLDLSCSESPPKRKHFESKSTRSVSPKRNKVLDFDDDLLLIPTFEEPKALQSQHNNNSIPNSKPQQPKPQYEVIDLDSLIDPKEDTSQPKPNVQMNQNTTKLSKEPFQTQTDTEKSLTSLLFDDNSNEELGHVLAGNGKKSKRDYEQAESSLCKVLPNVSDGNNINEQNENDFSPNSLVDQPMEEGVEVEHENKEEKSYLSGSEVDQSTVDDFGYTPNSSDSTQTQETQTYQSQIYKVEKNKNN
ncbi:Regulator of telomere elongation helicase 1 rtel1 [Entamoeba marina]